MRIFLAVLAVLVSLCTLAVTLYTMINKIEGWGWLMFLFFLTLQGTYQLIAIALNKNP